MPDAQAGAAALLSLDRLTRREFIETHQMLGKQLPPAVMELLLTQLGDSKGNPQQVLDMDWLRDMAQVMSPGQLVRLYWAGGVLDRWVGSLDSRKNSNKQDDLP